MVPVPFEGAGAVLLRIELSTGEVVKVSGKRAELRVVGPRAKKYSSRENDDARLAPVSAEPLGGQR